MVKIKFNSGIQADDMLFIQDIWPNRRPGDYAIHKSIGAEETIAFSDPSDIDKSIRVNEWLRQLRIRKDVEVKVI